MGLTKTRNEDVSLAKCLSCLKNVHATYFCSFNLLYCMDLAGVAGEQK